MDSNPTGPLRVLTSATLPEGVQSALRAAAAADTPFGPIEWLAAEAAGGAGVAPDVELIDAAQAAALTPDSADPAIVRIVVAAAGEDAALLDWLRHGVCDVVTPDELAAPTFPRRLRIAVERQRVAATAYATDLGTGLPHRQQLIEHMSHLLALREREPAPMAVLVLRIEGFETVAARAGRASADVLRRKVAVRLRAGLRASDVVASIGEDGFAVLLAWIDAPGDARGVAAKLERALQQPFRLAGHDAAVAVAIGVSLYPEHGKAADALLGEAQRQALGAAAQGRAGFANRLERGAVAAANDDDAPPG